MNRLEGIRLSNGLLIEFMASCALGFDGMGWYIERWPIWRSIWHLDPYEFSAIKTSTLTLDPRTGNGLHIQTIRPHLIDDWVENAVGWRNPGISWWCEHIGSKADSQKLPLIVSIGSTLSDGSSGELYAIAAKLHQYQDRIAGVEANFACPNVGHISDSLEIVKG
ncbi:MAG: dihydroorotate dehydrogenase, partial [Candidatus Berkelbacteria bacterium]|nr:dihydroorotate dehydrogenase [Candidatus Berkelbacteria bacterium]